MNKRGQFTLFVILGIILILVVGVVYYYRADLFGALGIGEELAYPSEVQEVATHVQECVDATASEAVVNIGYSGGYYIYPETTFYYTDLGLYVPYFYYDGEDISPSIDVVESELNEYITDLMVACVDLTQFTGFNITAGDFAVETDVLTNQVDIVVEHPVSVSVGTSTYDLGSSYETSVLANLGWVHTVARNIVQHDVENPDEIDYSYILGQGVAHTLVAPVSTDTYIIVITDTTSFGGLQNYTFMFAEYYSNLSYVGDCYEDLDCGEGFACENGSCVEVEVEEA